MAEDLLPMADPFEKLPTLVMRDFSSGVQTNINSGLVGATALRYTVNMYCDSEANLTGNLKSRLGLIFGKDIDDDYGVSIDQSSSISVLPSNRIIGMHALPSGVILVAVLETSDTYIYYASSLGNEWRDTGTIPFNWYDGNLNRIRFQEFNNYVFAVNKTYIKSWDKNPANDWGATHLTGAPTGSFINSFNGRLYVGGNSTNPHDLYFSSLITGGTITWDTTNNFIRINPYNNSDGIIGLETNSDLMIIFKDNSIFTWDGISTQSQPLFSNKILLNQESIQTIDNNTFFGGENERGYSVYLYNGSQIIEISDPVREWLNNMEVNSSVLNNFGSWRSKSKYFLHIGDVTLDNIIFHNVVLCYSLITNSWTTMEMKRYAYSPINNNAYTFSTQTESLITIIGGAPISSATASSSILDIALWDYNLNFDSSIWKPNSVLTDNGIPISILIQTHELEWGTRSRRKTINKFNIFASGNYGFVNVDMRVDGGEWIPLGGLTGKTTTFSPGLQGYYFEFRLKGSNTGEQFVFEGFEFFDVTIEPYET